MLAELVADPIEEDEDSSAVVVHTLIERKRPAIRRRELIIAAADVEEKESRAVKRLRFSSDDDDDDDAEDHERKVRGEEAAHHMTDMTSSWAEAYEKSTKRFQRLISQWFQHPASAVHCVLVEAQVTRLLQNIDSYGFINASSSASQEQTRMRLMCLADRFVASIGGVLKEDDFSNLLIVVSLVLTKLWCDHSLHMPLLQGHDIAHVAQLERHYLRASKFRIHISTRNLYDFSVRLRIL
jgi:hypothetical protein